MNTGRANSFRCFWNVTNGFLLIKTCIIHYKAVGIAEVKPEIKLKQSLNKKFVSLKPTGDKIDSSQLCLSKILCSDQSVAHVDALAHE